MFKFLTEAKQELEHVVWPTQKETQKYMTYTVGVIVTMAILLAVMGYILRSTLSIIRDQFPHQNLTTSISGEAEVKRDDVNNIIRSFSGRTNKTKLNTPKTDATGTWLIQVTPILPIAPVGQ